MSDTSFKTIFLHSYRRIWVGKDIFQWEILIQSFAAINIGLTPFGHLGSWQDPIVIMSYILAAVLTPLIIGMSILRAHVIFGIGDEALRIVPLKPHQILVPRMTAVLLTWIQLVLPFFLIFIAAAILNRTGIVQSEFDSLVRLLLAQLFMFSDFAPGYLRLFESGLLSPRIISIYACGILQFLSCITLPITWGFWMGSRRGRPHGLFLVQYFGYLIGPLVIAVMLHTGLMRIFVGWTDRFWGVVFCTSILGILLSGYFFYKACDAWGRGAR